MTVYESFLKTHMESWVFGYDFEHFEGLGQETRSGGVTVCRIDSLGVCGSVFWGRWL